MKKRIIFIPLFLFFLFGSVPHEAQSLRITLKRVIFEGPRRSEVITIINNKDEEATYRLGWRHLLMSETENLIAADEGGKLAPGVKSVADMVRFAPRRFTIPPKSSQQVRMMLRMPSDLEDGEYRSHLWVRPEANVEELRKKMVEENKNKGNKSGVSVKLLAGVTMPVIVRKGPLQATAGIESLQASQGVGVINVSFYLTRTGNKSVYGDLDIICSGAGETYLLRNSKGHAVYTEINRKNINLRIPKLTDKPACKTLTVKYYQTDKFMGKETGLLAEVSTSVTG